MAPSLPDAKKKGPRVKETEHAPYVGALGWFLEQAGLLGGARRRPVAQYEKFTARGSAIIYLGMSRFGVG